jgi:hypothetical protein
MSEKTTTSWKNIEYYEEANYIAHPRKSMQARTALLRDISTWETISECLIHKH